MADCPSIEQILDLVAGEQDDPTIAVHVDQCVACRRQYAEFRTLAALAADQIAQSRTPTKGADLELPPEGMSERIAARVRPAFEQRLAAAAAARIASGPTGKPPGAPKDLLDDVVAAAGRFPNALFGFDASVATPLRKALGESSQNRAQAVTEAIRRHDPLSLIAAGEEDDELVMAKPLWFTSLLLPPRQLSWEISSHDALQQWHVTLSSLNEGEILAGTTDTPYFELPQELASRFSDDDEFDWEVRRGADAPHGETFVRGVFRILNASARNEFNSCRATWQSSIPLQFDPSLAHCYYTSGLWEDLYRYLSPLSERFKSRADGFLIHRGLAALFIAVHNELTGPRMMGEPEGAWALELAQRHLQEAYNALSIDYTSL